MSNKGHRIQNAGCYNEACAVFGDPKLFPPFHVDVRE
jgi:hypothetical protein